MIKPFKIDSEGWRTGERHFPSPHFNARPEGMTFELLVVHNISLPPGQFGGPYITDLFLGQLDATAHPYFKDIAGLKVSAHCLIRRDGTVLQYVSFLNRAWHAGVSEYCGRSQCNDFSIGIELEGTDDIPYTSEQYDALVGLTHALETAYPDFNRVNITGHEHIAPERKTDPGPAFDWLRYRSLLDQTA